MSTPVRSPVGAALAGRLRRQSSTCVAATSRATPSQRQRVAFSTGINLLESEAISVGSLIEICGPSYVGKTAVLHHIVAHALIPRAISSNPGAQNGNIGVVWVAINDSVDVDLLNRIIVDMVSPCSDRDVAVQSCLSRLHVFHPEDSLSLVATLHAVGTFLETTSGAGVRLLVIDALGVQHYADAARAGKSEADNVGEAITCVVRTLLRDREITCFVSKCALFDYGPPESYRPFDEGLVPAIPQDFMPASWKSLVARTLGLSHATGGSRNAVLFSNGPAMNSSPPVAMTSFDIDTGRLRFKDISLAG